MKNDLNRDHAFSMQCLHASLKDVDAEWSIDSHMDVTYGVDYLIKLTNERKLVAFRARRWARAKKFRNEIALRYSRDSGAETEWTKIIEQGYGDLLHYTFCDETPSGIVVVDFSLLLLKTVREISQARPEIWTPHYHQGTVFLTADLADLEPAILKSSITRNDRSPFPLKVLELPKPIYRKPSSGIKYFFSGASGIRSEMLPDVAALIDYRLLSMHEAFKGNTRVWCDISNHPKSGMKEVMLDSGAFTAFMKGRKVALEDLIYVYNDTLRKLNPKLEKWLINLDVIPGAPGRVATPEETVQALEESDANFKILRARFGARVLPVFHQTEGIERLKEVASQGDYIALGFRQDFAESHRIAYAEEVLHYLEPLGKITHGLATTGYEMLRRTNFDSVDSATWLYVAAMGGITYRDQTDSLRNIAISESSPRQRELRQHFRSLSEFEQEYIVERLDKAGLKLPQVESVLSYRILFNAYEMTEWLRAYRSSPPRPEKGLFPI